MEIRIEELKKQSFKLIEEAKDLKTLENLRVRYLGRKGELTAVLRDLKNLSLEDKRKIGPAAQKFRQELEDFFDSVASKLASAASSGKTSIDVTMPGRKIAVGHLHLLTMVEKEIRDIFKAMNFSVVDGPEVESEYYNFDALNIPQNHPARDMWDTFWLQDNQNVANGKWQMANGNDKLSAISHRLLLRTHTSPVQIRYMEMHKPPFQIIVPGKVFRFEATDASHETNFYQVEGLMVGKDVSLANLKFVIREFFKRLFDKKINIRLRPSYFPFVEPGLEVDVQCVKCGGKGLISQSGTADSAKRNLGCNICKNSGWLEIMGAGMVHPRVFEAAHYNPEEYQGFAFGLGLERIAMIKYGIPDIRLFYSGDLRFINQF
ncbi:MAG: phenylalanyl-tRNA synthetase alpha chain [Parcubacteria group bacterium Athens0714_26]|nr:MAG: phenylalanyl-tRNA synthetase alpha chain [Parcubacteria group bacterium Athens1014_26]TSD03249.1 MAG: phenylalanyl-tRNA synthetase alpha chain [Parcubacteria group bacterium Athens0714_26]